MSFVQNYIVLTVRQGFCFLLTFCSLAPIYAQPPNLDFESFDTHNGLSQNLVFAIAQDQKGFLWFGTDEGLNRFDGHEFRIFRHDENDSTTLADNSIHAIVVDNAGVIWIGTANGISRYYPQTEKMEQLPVDYDDVTKPKGTGVNEMKKDADGNIWIAYLGSGIDVFDQQTRTFMHYTTHRQDKFRIINDYVISMQFMPDGDKLLGTRSGIQFLGKDGVPLSAEQAEKKYPWGKKIDPSITSFHLSADNETLWIGSELQGVYRVDLTSSAITNFTTRDNSLKFNNNVPSVFEDSRGNVWVGGEAIYLYDKEKNKLLAYDERGIQGNIINKNPVLSIFEDKDHNVWFGTFRLGVLKYNPDNTRILHFHTGQGPGSISNDQILSFGEDINHKLWVGTDGGGFFSLKDDMTGFVEAKGSEKFPSQVVKCIYEDRQGMLWLGTWDGGMMRYNPTSGEVKAFNPEAGNFESRHVWDIRGDSLGNLWVGTLRDGLCYFEPATGKSRYFKSMPEDSSSIANNDIMCLFNDSGNRLWVGTSNGLSILNPGSDKFINFVKTELNVTVLSIYEDPQQRIWLGTNGGGIVIMDKHLRVVRSITEKDGLPSSTVCSILSDTHNNIWVSTYNGLAKIDWKDGTITEVPQIAGLQGREFIPRAGYKTSDGRMMFGGVNGFNLFHPDSLQFNQVARPVVFTSLKISNAEVQPGKPYEGRYILSKTISDEESLQLSYQDRSFTITFASLTYNWQNNLFYAYFLEGLDDEWQYSTADKRFIHYTNLDPGSYTLKVKSSFDGKTWPARITSIRIDIKPPWWGTLWFEFLAALATGWLLYIVYRTRVKFLKNQQEKLEEIVRLRTRELEKSNGEIQNLLEEVAQKKEQIEQQMLELRQVNEEIGAQRDTLEVRSTELERAQERLKDVNASLEALVEKRTQKLSDALRELETFLYRASHDLRGPISSMLGLISASKLEKDPVRYNAMYSEYLQRTVMSLDRTLQKLLQKHTIEKKKIQAERITKPMLLILLNNLLKELPCYRPADLELEVDDDLIIETDRMMLTIVLSNLLENAFFFSDGAGDKKVIVEFHSSGRGVQISVEDHGPGIKHEVKDKIFTMFYRGHELSTGNGLGLYLVKNVLTKMNGSVEVETQEGVYSRFIVRLPHHLHQLHLN
jgi:ligand-binding sensor domain-containing protein/signal transduction histidine kinase